MRVLHIEDHLGITEIVRTLCDGRFHIDTAFSLTHAREFLISRSYDVLLVDLNLGDSKGMDTIRALKSYAIPMVVLTADPTEAFARAAAKVGVADYLTKSLLCDIDLPCRLAFVVDKSRKSTLKWERLDEMKQYLSCAAFA